MKGRDLFNISRLAIAFPKITIGFWLAVIVAGVFASGTLRFSLLPDITFPVVLVTASSSFSSPDETAKHLTLPLEGRLKSLEGLNEMRSVSYSGQAVVSLQFRGGLTLGGCVQEAEKALAGVVLPGGSSFKVTPMNLNQSSAVTYAIPTQKESPAEIAAILKREIVPPLSKVNGVHEVVLLGEMPSAEETNKAPMLVRFNGQPALALEIIKRPDANTLQVVQAVKSEIERLQGAYPAFEFVLARTQADYIDEAAHSTLEALLIAVALSVLVILPFLRSWPATLISALAIPTSLLGTMIVMAICGFELDTITLLALALVIGIIIDDAIVDVENIARHLEEGSESPRLAALTATKEIGLTVAAATFTIVAVFLPVSLMDGVVGQFFKPFGLTVSAAVLISLLVARTLSPLLAVHWLRPIPKRSSQPWSSLFAHTYRVTLIWSLGHRKTVICCALLSFVGGLLLIPLIPKGLIPRLDRREFKLVYRVDSAMGEERFRTSVMAGRKLERFARAYPDVEDVYLVIGSREGDPGRGTVFVRLAETPRKRAYSSGTAGTVRRVQVTPRYVHTAEVEDRIRSALPKIEGVTISVEGIPFIELENQKPINAAILGSDRIASRQAASALADRLRGIPGFVDLSAPSGEEADSAPIERLNMVEAAYLTANLTGQLSLGEATEKLVASAREVLGEGMILRLGGDSDNLVKVFGAFGKTLGLSVGCILLVLVLLFRNWVDPIVIVLSLPLSVVGAVAALLVARGEFGMISLLGVVFLFGLVNKNAILLVDYINQLRSSGVTRMQAILRAARVRARPILMTTLATILGMLPVALGLGVGSELRAPMAIAIIGGLITSTLLSLIVVPVVYLLLDGGRRRRFMPR